MIIGSFLFYFYSTDGGKTLLSDVMAELSTTCVNVHHRAFDIVFNPLKFHLDSLLSLPVRLDNDNKINDEIIIIIRLMMMKRIKIRVIIIEAIIIIIILFLLLLLQVWSSDSVGSSLTSDLPDFSFIPQEYITNV